MSTLGSLEGPKTYFSLIFMTHNSYTIFLVPGQNKSQNVCGTCNPKGGSVCTRIKGPYGIVTCQHKQSLFLALLANKSRDCSQLTQLLKTRS